MSKHKKNKPAATVAQPAPPVKEKNNAANGLNSMTNWLIVLIAVLPVLFSRQTMDPAIAVRYIFISGFMLLFVLYFFARTKTFRSFSFPPLAKWVFIAGAGFAVWLLVSMGAALNFREGYYELARHLLNLFVLFAVMVTVTREEPRALKLCKALVLVSFIQSMAGIGQYYEFAFTDLPGANAKPFGLMANRNLFGSAQALLLPFVLFVLYKGGRVWKWLAGFATAGLIVSILLSQTRSAWLATLCIILVSVTLVSIFSIPNRKKWLTATAAGIAAAAVLVLLVLLTDTEGTMKKSVTERAKSLTRSSDGTDQSTSDADERVRIWYKTMDMIRDKPITGAGPGNWKLAIPSYGTEGLVWAYGKYGPDRPHNVYLHVASETGIPGAVLYFSMWLLIAAAGFIVIRKSQSEDQRILTILMLAGLAALACDSLFSFPTERIEHSLYIMLMGGIILGCYAKTNDTKKMVLQKPLIVAACFILAFNLFLGFSKYNFEYHLNRVKAFENQKRYQEMADEASEAKSSFITLGADVGLSLELKKAIALKELKQYDRALWEIGMAKRYHPNSAAVWNTEGTIYTDLKQYDKAIYCYERAMKITPYFNIVLQNLALNYFMANNFKGCIATLDKLNIENDEYLKGMKKEAERRLAAPE